MTPMCHLAGTEFCDSPATCFVRTELEDGESYLSPHCEYHRGECFHTVVPLADGMSEYVVQEVMDE